MSFSPFRLALAPLAVMMLASFRMPVNEDAAERMLFDVRGAFVTAQPDVPRELIAWTDSLVDASIQSTTRSFMLPRTILTVRIGQAKRTPLLIGNRYSASITVKAISVGSGEPIAEGSFEASVLRFGKDGADMVLAERIAERIASEFRLGEPRRGALVTALSEAARN
jgi:hypothetical protein